MKRYVLVRALYSVVTLWLLVTIIFGLVRLTGDPVAMKAEAGADPAYVAQLRHRWGLDQPLYRQYVGFVGQLLRADFGHSFEKSLPVRDIYFERLPNSLKLGFAAFLISLALGVPFGMLSALKVNSMWDNAGKVVALLGLSMPGFFVGLVLIIVFGIELGWLPVLGKGSSALVGSAPSTWVTFWFRDWGHLAMPAFALGWYFSGAMLRITRSGMLDVLGSDYIKLVRLKGVPEPMVVAKHALKNSLIPVLTFAGLNLLIMVNVAVVIEVIFNWPGAGHSAPQQARSREADSRAVPGEVRHARLSLRRQRPALLVSGRDARHPARHRLSRPRRAEPAAVRGPHLADRRAHRHALRGRDRHRARRPGRLYGPVVGRDHHADHRRLADLALAGLRDPPVERPRAGSVERGAHPRARVLESVLARRPRRGADAPRARFRQARGDQRHRQAHDHLAAFDPERDEHRHGALQPSGRGGGDHRGIVELPGRRRSAPRAVVGSHDGAGTRIVDGRKVVARDLPGHLHHAAGALGQHARGLAASPPGSAAPKPLGRRGAGQRPRHSRCSPWSREPSRSSRY